MKRGMQQLGLWGLLVGCGVAGAACNDIPLFGQDAQPKPQDTRPPDWDDSYGLDKYFYFWRIVPDYSQGHDKGKGVVFRQEIDGANEPEQFWVAPSGKCVGCHSVSRDGKYMAVVELTTRFGLDPSVHVVDIATQTEVTLPGGPLAGTFTSWEPTAPGVDADRFVMASPFGLQIASVTSGLMTTLTETASDGWIASMPSWGPDGRIVYARSHYGDSRIVLYREAELWSIAADGTDNQVLWADPTRMSYFPEWSPAGRWIAFTDGPADANSSSFSSTQARIRILDTLNQTIVNPDDLNDTSSAGRTWATWSAVGNRLTCSTANATEDSDVYIVEFDKETGVDFNSEKLDMISTEQFEHIPRWAP